MVEFDPSPERATAMARANLRTVLRSMPVLRLIFVLRDLVLEQRQHSTLLMRLQDIHSLRPFHQ